MHSPFVDCSVDNVLLQTSTSQSLSELTDISKQRPIKLLLHITANTVEWTMIRAVTYVY